MPSFLPNQVLISREALRYPLGAKLADSFREREILVNIYEQRIPTVPLRSFRERYMRSKRTLVIAVRQRREFQTCKPSANYQLPLVSGCPGMCQYCYLNTNLGRTPYVRIYVNVDEILDQAEGYVKARRPQDTVFEGSATSDPVAVEAWTGSLARAIERFAQLDGARFRFATKYLDVDGFLGLDHRGKTEIRFSINCNRLIEEYERGTPSLSHRLIAAARVAAARYPLGFLIAPVFVYEGWQTDYDVLLEGLRKALPDGEAPLTFEVISHRFTSRAKGVIEEVYPGTSLPMDEEERRFKYGQFGYGKYVYPIETMEEMADFFRERIGAHFPEARILYIV